MNVNPAFHNSRSLYQRVDRLDAGPAWNCESFRVTGDRQDRRGNALFEDLELWHRNPVDCIQELLENPAFENHVEFAPQRVYRTNVYTHREYGEMWTADWWWDKQVSSHTDHQGC